MAFTDELRQAADPIWSAQHEHPFVRAIGEGSLDPDKFRHYVRQDYLFLIDYARLLALGCARAPRLDEMTRFAELARAVLGSEMELHRSYLSHFRPPPICQRLPPVAPAGLHKGSILRCLLWLRRLRLMTRGAVRDRVVKVCARLV
jgi:TENA/THI-4/PQQC family